MINRLFDYVYYRTAFLDKKRDGDSSSAHIAVVSLQLFFLIAIIGFLSLIFIGRGLIQEVISLQNIQYLIIIMMIILGVYNSRKYKGKYEEFHQRWGNEPQNKRKLHGFLIVLSHFILIGLMIGLAYVG